MEEEKKLEILVVEDNPKHLEKAKEQLGEKYNLTIATNYADALKYLTPDVDKELRDKLRDEGKSRSEAKKEAKIPLKYDVVLSDLMMPAGELGGLGTEGEKFKYDEMPHGFPIALLAAKEGVKYVAVITDTNHHNHPISASLDAIGGAYWDHVGEDHIMKIENSRVLFAHAPMCMVEDDRGIILPGDIKDWKKALDMIYNEKVE